MEAAGFEVNVHPNFHDLEAENGASFMNMVKMMDCGKMEDFRNANDVVFVNAYGNTRTSIREAIAKITGKSEFTGVASDTVFCGKWDTGL